MMSERPYNMTQEQSHLLGNPEPRMQRYGVVSMGGSNHLRNFLIKLDSVLTLCVSVIHTPEICRVGSRGGGGGGGGG